MKYVGDPLMFPCWKAERQIKRKEKLMNWLTDWTWTVGSALVLLLLSWYLAIFLIT